MPPPLVGIIMGSQSDWPTLRPPPRCSTRLALPMRAHRLGPPHARPALCLCQGRGGARPQGHHRRRRRRGASAGHDGVDDHAAGAGRAGGTKALKGLDSLLSIVQMPGGVPVATFAIGEAGAKNAALMPPQSWRCPTRRSPSGSPPGASARPARSPRSGRHAMTIPHTFPPVAPGGTIGILGGGQLGRMLALAAARLG